MNPKISESYEEIQAGDAYYDLDINRLGTMAAIHLREAHEVNTRAAWMSGWFFDPTVQAELDSDRWCADNDDAALTVKVEDNGCDGDGLHLDFVVVNGFESDRTLASLRLSPRQATALARALLCAVSMRGMP